MMGWANMYYANRTWERISVWKTKGRTQFEE